MAVWFDRSPEVIITVVTMYIRFPLSLRQVEDHSSPAPPT
jgi:transposase-like protein